MHLFLYLYFFRCSTCISGDLNSLITTEHWPDDIVDLKEGYLFNLMAEIQCKRYFSLKINWKMLTLQTNFNSFCKSALCSSCYVIMLGECDT